jgi:hypothetical protein
MSSKVLAKVIIRSYKKELIIQPNQQDEVPPTSQSPIRNITDNKHVKNMLLSEKISLLNENESLNKTLLQRDARIIPLLEEKFSTEKRI